MMAVLAGGAAVLAGVGVAQALLASRLVVAFAGKPRELPAARPPVTVLKPLYGDEPLLEAALATLCRQDYPAFQIVFGVQDAADPAVAAVRRVQARFPHIDSALVIDPALHGINRKVGNLINMSRVARHHVLVIADSDVHVRPDYLDRLAAALQQPGVGLVTTLYAGLPVAGTTIAPSQRRSAARIAASPSSDHAAASLPARLGATQITHGFLPGALLSRALGRQDCLGATMCLRRDDLERIGGLQTLVHHLADDNVLGRRIVALGLRVALADTVPLTTVPEASLGALFRHELRWARTIRALEPAAFAASIVQYSLAWALLAVALSGGALWSISWLLLAWLLRAAAALSVDRALAPGWTEVGGPGAPDHAARDRAFGDQAIGDQAALAFCCPVWLLPLRDIFSVAVMLASYGGRQVDWRGHNLRADAPPPSNLTTVPSAVEARWPIEENHAR